MGKYGVNGVMEVAKLMKCGFDPIIDFAIDAMHLAFLGVIKYLTGLWLLEKWASFPFSIHKRVNEIDSVMKQNAKTIPHEFSRSPRGFRKSMAHYKGTITVQKKKFILPLID